jgi:ATP-dependent RNA helicase RhlE
MTENDFEGLALSSEILSALQDAGYSKPTDIQLAAIPVALTGKDIMATAQTGTGKTAAFALPLLYVLQQAGLNKSAATTEQANVKSRGSRTAVRGLILSPTRELAQQIESNLQIYGKNLDLRISVLVGGLPITKQIRELNKGVDIIVATPGRLLDLLNRKAVQLNQVDFFVLDEADRMLDMGFVHDVRDIARALRTKPQTLLFSATTSPQVEQLSSVLLQNPVRIAVDPPQSVGDNITQKVYFVDQGNKRDLLIDILSKEEIKRALVFTETKSNANVVAAVLSRAGLNADTIHSDKSQKDRQKALQDFDSGKITVLVATDVMARGIDVDGISHVINFELPRDAENFVHRIGRTARAGATGIALSFCDNTEVGSLRGIENFTGETLEADESHRFHSPFVAHMKKQASTPFGRSSGRRRSGFGRR